MSHSLHRLLAEAVNKPHLITETALTPILAYLSDRSYRDVQMAVSSGAKQAPRKPERLGGTGEVRIDGPLTYRPVQADCAPEGCSYQSVVDQVAQLIDMGVDTILLTHSSPGGEASHAFDTAKTIREMATDAGVNLVSYVDTYSASASYLLACVADIVIAHPEASVGSIGCVVALADVSKRLSNEGIKPIYITSTKGKVPYTEDGSFSESFLEEIQAQVTKLGNQFANHVAEYTGVPVSEILSMDAKMFSADDAKMNGLINEVMTHKQLANYLAEINGAKNARPA